MARKTETYYDKASHAKKPYWFPVFQLRADMANRKTKIEDGLRLAALTTVKWLRERVNIETNDFLSDYPEPEDYLDVPADEIPSMHLDGGSKIDIFSDIGNGIWSLRMTECWKLPREDGEEEEKCGLMDTDIGFRVVGKRLECGFRVVLSNLSEKEPPKWDWMPGIVERLADHPQFGLTREAKLDGAVRTIKTVTELKILLKELGARTRNVPIVIFMPEAKSCYAVGAPSSFLLKDVQIPAPSALFQNGSLQLPDKPTYLQSAGQAYDRAGIAKKFRFYCTVYEVPDKLFSPLAWGANREILGAGDILVQPLHGDSSCVILPYYANKSRQEQNLEQLKKDILSHVWTRDYDFGDVIFQPDAEKLEYNKIFARMEAADASVERWKKRAASTETACREKLQEKDNEIAALKQQVERMRKYQERIEAEKEQMRAQDSEELKEARRLLRERDEDITYLQRKLDQPKAFEDIPAWVEKHFNGKLLLHPRAVGLLRSKQAKGVDVSLVCDALDFLATDYWSGRYERMPRMLDNCSFKYGRPFTVEAIGQTTIKYTPTQYMIKYFSNANGDLVDSPLDYHLRVGNDTENLLRIYFLHDDKNKLIVVGSLPRHLRAVSINV